MVRALLALAVTAALSGCAASVPEAPTQVDGQQAAAPPFSEAPSQLWATPKPFAVGRSRATTLTHPQPVREAAYSNEQLARNFIQIALRSEAADRFGQGIAKWQTPLRYSIDGARPKDIARIRGLLAHIRSLTGIDIAEAETRRPNFHISFVPFRFRDAATSYLLEAGQPYSPVRAMVERWRGNEREKCLGLINFDPDGESIITNARILIKDELPPALRDACIVEEIVQSMGLMNDDPNVIPSIFNDDQVYNDLTSHDEYLLRILYDPRVRPGMRAGEVWPIANRIIYQLRPPARPVNRAAWNPV